MLLNRNPPVNDPSALILLEDLSQSISDNDEFGPLLDRIWERAATFFATPNAWIYREWFNVKFQTGLYLGAKQVCSPFVDS